VIENSDLVKNYVWGGGLEILLRSGAVVTGSMFSGNSVGWSGGGIHVSWSGPHI